MIIVSGVAGFLGSNLAKRLLQEGYSVCGIDDLSTGRIENIRPILDQISFYEHHIDNNWPTQKLLWKIFKTQDITHVFHFAATVGVKNVVESPTQTIFNNIDATHAIVEIASYLKIPLYFASTSECYGKNTNLLHETDDVIYGPSTKARWAYATSKYIDEIICLDAIKKYDAKICILRFFNVSGRGQSGDYGMVLPRFINQAKKNEPLTVFGDGQQTRNFTHVEDLTDILMNLLGRPDQSPRGLGRVLNVGSNQEVTILEVAAHVIKTLNSSSIVKLHSEKEVYPGQEFEDMKCRKPEISQLIEVLGYEPKFRDYKEIVKDIIEHGK